MINQKKFEELIKEKDKFYIILEGSVYEVSNFLLLHPGGSSILRENSSKDITPLFKAIHPHVDYKRLLKDMYIDEYTENNDI